jgi:hypothetical protein
MEVMIRVEAVVMVMEMRLEDVMVLRVEAVVMVMEMIRIEDAVMLMEVVVMEVMTRMDAVVQRAEM